MSLEVIETNTKMDVYKCTFETWRWQVSSYWQRNTYFAAFETAALGGCSYLLENKHLLVGAVFSALGLTLTVVWLWSNHGVHKYIDYWLNSIKTTEESLSLSSCNLDFVNMHPGSGLRLSLAFQGVPMLFAVAWVMMIAFAGGWHVF